MTLLIIEIRRTGDDGVVDGGSEVTLSDFLHLCEDHGGDFLRGESLLLPVDFDLSNQCQG